MNQSAAPTPHVREYGPAGGIPDPSGPDRTSNVNEYTRTSSLLAISIRPRFPNGSPRRLGIIVDASRVCKHRVVRNEQRLRTGTPESRAFAERVQVVMTLTSRLNLLPSDDLDARRRSVIAEIFGRPIPDSLSILPPFYCDYGLGASFGERVFINQGCFFLDYGGITIGDRVLIGPRVTLSTAGHPVEVDERFELHHPRPNRHRGRRMDRCGRHHRPGSDHRPRLGRRRGHGSRKGRATAERGDGNQHRRAKASAAADPEVIDTAGPSRRVPTRIDQSRSYTSATSAWVLASDCSRSGTYVRLSKPPTQRRRLRWCLRTRP